jgi:hypothetical protein
MQFFEPEYFEDGEISKSRLKSKHSKSKPKEIIRTDVFSNISFKQKKLDL